MADYGPNEIVDMIMILGESRNNYAAAARLYAERYPNRRHPSASDFSRHFGERWSSLLVKVLTPRRSTNDSCMIWRVLPPPPLPSSFSSTRTQHIPLSIANKKCSEIWVLNLHSWEFEAGILPLSHDYTVESILKC
ncbi:hypothetical protein TSAR_002064 [Trichomalopsis sarcophagae]|uniref:DUF4817 domain-containing protein n=1 Tax=Trichomalopsis sarcophagae TaxID=543379 RepID=A0A232EJB0_9HYME|nr:hypothetical protein TSAR_002064 [Trichomalopsis sarcophagae]